MEQCIKNRDKYRAPIFKNIEGEKTSLIHRQEYMMLIW